MILGDDDGNADCIIEPRMTYALYDDVNKINDFSVT